MSACASLLPSHAHKLDRWSRIAFPATFVVLTWWSLIA